MDDLVEHCELELLATMFPNEDHVAYQRRCWCWVPVCSEACCSSLYHFYFMYEVFAMGVPNGAAVF